MKISFCIIHNIRECNFYKTIFYTVRTLNQDQEQDLLLYLYESSQDPEVRPGLFEGDIAMTNEVYILYIFC